MKTILFAAAVMLLLGCFDAVTATACTTFTLNDKRGNIFFGRNFDYMVGDAQVTINKRGLKKKALIKPPEKQLTWTSQLGSVTFNLIGREFSMGGMNEAGLVVEIMRLEQTKYPEMDNRYGLSTLQWVQYQLDNSKTVEDVINSNARVRISPQSTALDHFLVSDSHGNTAIIEYLDGKMKYYSGSAVKHRVLANSPYETSLGYLARYAGFGGDMALPARDESSQGRFSIAASLVQKYKGDENPVAYSFNILDRVWQTQKKEWETQWSIVYDITNRNIYYRTAKNKEIRSVALKEFDFGCAAKSKIIDIDKPLAGASDFSEYSPQAHRDLIERVFNAVPAFRSIPPERRDALVHYSENITCGESR